MNPFGLENWAEFEKFMNTAMVRDLIDNYEHCKQIKVEEISKDEIFKCCKLISGWLACNRGYIGVKIIDTGCRFIRGVTCPTCGTITNRTDIHYCPHCGTKLPELPDEEGDEE